eukprot:4938233-Pleurochrysis_carterae.AAC.1
MDVHASKKCEHCPECALVFWVNNAVSKYVLPYSACLASELGHAKHCIDSMPVGNDNRINNLYG